MTIADRIRLKREELDLTQEALALKCGYSDKSSITKIEKSGNDITLKKIQRVAEALNVTPSYLMGWEDVDGNRTQDGELADEYMAMELHKREQAMRLYDYYMNAIPQIRKAVDDLLKPPTQDS